MADFRKYQHTITSKFGCTLLEDDVSEETCKTGQEVESLLKQGRM